MFPRPASDSPEAPQENRSVPFSGGFTLIELSIVLFVIAIVSGIAIPRLRDLTAAELTSTTRRLANTARYLAEEAAFRSTTYALNLDIENNAWWVTRFDRNTGEFRGDDSLLSRRVALSPEIRISDVVLPALGKVSEGVAPTYFYPEGYADPTVIHLVDARNNAMTVRVDPVRGLGEVFEGYKDFDTAS
ncbi:MAG: pilus assembly FimT family protein [Candidatus Binatia bacterium]